MVSSPSAVVPTVSLRGPFWHADIEIVELANPQRNLAFRNLWLEQFGPGAADSDQLYLPGTSIVLGCVRQVTVTLANDKTYLWRRSQTPAPAAETPAHLRTALATGELTLFLVQVDPQAWPVDRREGAGAIRPQDLPPLTCLAGEIALDTVLSPQGQATERLYADLDLEPPDSTVQLSDRPGATRLRSPLSVHSSGLSIYGGIDLPWQTQQLQAPLQLAQTFSPSASDPADIIPGPFYLSLEVARLISAERQAWVAAWRQLSQYLTPRNPLNGRLSATAEAGPHWVTLEVTNPTAIPDLYWQIRPGDSGRILNFARDSFSLIFSNQSPYDLDNPPTSLGRVSGTVTIPQPTGDGPASITITLEAGTETPEEDYRYQYQITSAPVADPSATATDEALAQPVETISLNNLTLAFDPVKVPEFLRNYQGLPLPSLGAGPLAPPILWGFMPLERGWFQLPIPNLTEQIYLDSDLARPLPSTSAASSLIQGAVALGNDDPTLLSTDYPNEQPWNLVLTNVDYLKGTWTLTPDEDEGYRLSQINLRGAAPELILNGLFWLSTARPLAQDALPNLDNWVSGVRSHPLRTVRETDLFPAAVEIKLAELTLSARALPPLSASEPKPVVAELGTWNFSYEVNGEVLVALVQKEVLPTNTFSQFLPWVWQHHGTLPMVQALPLTQTLVPPNYPSPNRQLIPFELGVKTITVQDLSVDVPEDWQFTVDGARDWPQPAQILPAPDRDLFSPAREWDRLFDLPLVSLSLPGLVLDPDASDPGLAVDATLNLPTQYRFDLPYTDEPNALAQLPEPPQDPEVVSPLPDSPLPQPPRPLLRDTFVDQWEKLSQRASLASGDAVTATTIGATGSRIQALVEPFDWPVQTTLNLTTYPGRLSLANQGNGNGSELQLVDEDSIVLEDMSALEGISGQFSQNSTTFSLVAGSLMATPVADGVRDQRGVVRSASRLVNELIKTPVSLQLEPEVLRQYDLTTTPQPLSLQVGDRPWQLWFRDLPIQRLEPANPQFSRQHTQSEQAEDINDPNALGREYNLLTGYEWRLGDSQQPGQAFLPFFGLHFYPLTLETLTLVEEDVQTLRLIGRLQLPLSAAGEAIPDLSSEVQITFAKADNGTLTLSVVESIPPGPDTPPQGIWPLALDNNETTNAPQITWGHVQLQGALETGDLALVFTKVWLNFFLFDSAWVLPLDESLIFPQVATNPVQGQFNFPPVNPLPALDPRQASVTLRLAAAQDAFRHTASLKVDVHLGQMAGPGATAPQPTFKATLDMPLVQPSPENRATWASASLFAQLPLEPRVLKLNHRALEFEWQQPQSLDQTLHLLPGMSIATGAMPGFAALTFIPKTQPNADAAAQFPSLELATAFLETILTCRWGKSLQTTNGATPPEAVVVNADRDRVFSASAGDIVFGYTTRWVPPTDQPGIWAESLLLNGFLEVKNLISWPLALRSHDEVEAESEFKPFPAGIVLPALPTPDDDGRALSHLRHTLRVLLNQHHLPIDRLTLGDSGQVFQLRGDRPWELLAVTEHQLVTVLADSAQAYRLGNQRRWTTTQAVRIMPVGLFKTFLNQGTASTLDPTQGITSLNQASLGIWHRELQLTDPDSPLNQLELEPMLMVEASAPHWIRTSPVTAASPTTLQFLPNGSQLGILSNPQDYGPSDPHDPDWLLLNMPFWGRLLNSSPDLETSTNPILRDPVDLLAQAQVSDLALALSSWAETTPLAFTLAGFDTAAGRTWERLDPLSLEESWFRLNHPLDEAQSTQLQSILAALPSTPARLSRAIALGYAYDPLRLNYPPVEGQARAAIAPSEEADPSLLIHGERSRSLIGSLQVLYTFHQGADPRRVNDVSGGDAPLDLTIADLDRVEWLNGGGLRIKQATRVTADQPALNIINPCRATKELTIEAWIKVLPNQTEQRGPARIITLSRNTTNRYFTLGHGKNGGQPASQYVVRLRIENQTDSNGLLNDGSPPIETSPGSVTPGNGSQDGLTHLVFTRRANGEMTFYINGRAEKSGSTIPNNLFPSRPNENADQTFRFALANELTNDRPWLGEYYLVAVYSQAVTQAEVEMLRQKGLEGRRQGTQAPYSWHQTALQLKTGGLFPPAPQEPTAPEPAAPSLIRHAAATVLPARLTVNGQANPRPVSLAVSPYLGLEFEAVPDGTLTTQLASIELLCLEGGSGNLRPVASSLVDRELLDKSATSLEEISQRWAGETHQRLTPESPIAVLRYREILSTASQAVVTRYRFQVLTVPPSGGLAQRVFSLRSPVRHRRCQSGQFGGCQLPSAPRPFELAAPQTTGVQPLYLNQRPEMAGENQTGADWPWGLSGLRLSVQYGDRRQPALGLNNGSPALWWQAPNYGVQYRVNDPTRPNLPTAGLPPYFRPGAIKTLLPVLPSLPMPAEGVMATADWQPILPGQLRYLLTGDRPGVMMVIRNQLLKQMVNSSEPLLVSGSVPVQHRVPRPVVLPPNVDRDRALQPWASYFEPQRNLLATAAPADEAFFAECGGNPAQRLRLQIKSPPAGAIDRAWDGQLTVSISPTAIGWVIQLQLVDGLQTFSYIPLESSIAASQVETQQTYDLSPTETTRLQNALASHAPGDTIRVMARVKPAAATDNFWQTLVFPLRITDPDALPLPLRPTFIHFEDPEYNRQLASNAATAAVSGLESRGDRSVPYTITLACDRQEYSPQSTVFVRYDWSDNRPGVEGHLAISQINAAGIVRKLNWPEAGDRTPDPTTLTLASDRLEPISLASLQAENEFTLTQGDSLEITLTLTISGQSVPVVLSVIIVDKPVIPVPQAAYGLLRGLAPVVDTAAIDPEPQGAPAAVECTRFAWGPAASRIELVCAEDLRTGVVRRRAVFQWGDTTRPTPSLDQQYYYGVQKITQTGSTHQPTFEPASFPNQST